MSENLFTICYHAYQTNNCSLDLKFFSDLILVLRFSNWNIIDGMMNSHLSSCKTHKDFAKFYVNIAKDCSQYCKRGRFTGLNFCVFHSFQGYQKSFFL